LFNAESEEEISIAAAKQLYLMLEEF